MVDLVFVTAIKGVFLDKFDLSLYILNFFILQMENNNWKHSWLLWCQKT